MNPTEARNGPGRRPMEGRKALLAAVWKEVYVERHMRGARSARAACQRLMKRKRRIDFNDANGKRKLTILTWQALRDLYNDAEAIRKSADPDSMFAQCISATQRELESGALRAQFQLGEEMRRRLRHLKRDRFAGGRVVTSADLSALFEEG